MEARLTFCHEVVRARGHPNIKSTHRTTFEITKDPDITPRGDCIIGTSADKAPADFSSQFKECLKSDDAVLFILLEANGVRDVVVAHGHSQLLLTDEKKLIVRKSTYIEPATIGILASKSSAELRRELINALKKRDTHLTAHLLVLRLDQITSIYTQPRRVL
ncbi:MAG: DUF371 domain-containing protein [Desulfurococcaceae archaeon]